jgi:hypothetical protein
LDLNSGKESPELENFKAYFPKVFPSNSIKEFEQLYKKNYVK